MFYKSSVEIGNRFVQIYVFMLLLVYLMSYSARNRSLLRYNEEQHLISTIYFQRIAANLWSGQAVYRCVQNDT